MQTLATLGDADARIALEVIRAEIVRRGKAAVIAVADAHGETIALLRMDGAALSSIVVAANKAFTAARLRRPSRVIGGNVRHPQTGFDICYYGDPRYVGWAGGLPVVIDGTVVGSVAVSGLSSDEDEDLARMGIAAIMAAAGEGS
jgi:glc operon protein GlcG